MKRIFYLFCFLPVAVFSQVYTMPTVGIAGEYVGACEVATCTGTFTDDGGAGNYSLNINYIYRVFCPNAAGNCIKVTFNSYSMEGMVDPAGPPPLDCYYDYLTIGNGPTQNSTLFTTAPATATGRICGSPVTPFSYTSTHPSGCLTMRFRSDGVVTMPGWSATISCVPCAGGPSGVTNADCAFATAICGNSGNAGNASGPGIVAEGCTPGGCPAGGENHSNWYTFTILAGGTLAFNIVPSVITDDYDFALYGPGTTCGALGAPIRCSDAGTTGNTGMAAPNVDLTESVTGNGWVAPLNVLTGQTYYLVVDEWTPTGAGYNLNFTGTATFDCVVLPVELLNFDAKYSQENNWVELDWSTATETNNDFYTVEKTTDGVNYQEVVRVRGAGTVTTPTEYITVDTKPTRGTSYYRLKQTDFNGASKYSSLASVNISADIPFPIVLHPNPASNSVNVEYNSMAQQLSTITIYDFTGKIVYSSEAKSEVGNNTQNIDLSSLSQGFYLVTVKTDNMISRSRLIIN